MDNATSDSMDEPLDFLLQPEKIKIFIDMLEKRIGAGENQLEQIQSQRKQVEDAIRGLKSKLEILKNYSQFIDSKGFGYAKQQADDYFKEMEAAASSRLTAEEPPEVEECREYYQLGSLINICRKPKDHPGECSP